MFAGSSPSSSSAFSDSGLTPSLDMSNTSTAGLDGWTAGFGDQPLTDAEMAAHITSFTSINGNNNEFRQLTAAGGTISPKDLINESVPNSTAMTNLTSPSPWETPLDDFETSPLFDNLQSDQTLGGADQWYSLFPDQDPDNDVIQRSTSQRSFDSAASASPLVLHPGGQSNRKMSTTASPAIKHSQSAGVHKKNRELPPILADPADPIAVKRARNTAAARKSRDRKVKKFEEMEAEIAQLRQERAELQAEMEQWRQRALAKGS
ncbi:MAG: hypothetical protein M1821_005499 [Bathelium mastoideum]|nr:MAG: hypothetical protein M1821_005499 [Bathelium mastoideum]KAI9691828.1 MAG: hypothetical protein M1822_007900 [Bathelium mastoideum]